MQAVKDTPHLEVKAGAWVPPPLEKRTDRVMTEERALQVVRVQRQITLSCTKMPPSHQNRSALHLAVTVEGKLIGVR